MILDLINKGCVPKKSLILKFPTENVVPNNLIRHFIRGYFDGDGCVFFRTYKVLDKRVNKKIDSKNYTLNFVGTKEFLLKIKTILSSELQTNKDIEIRPKGKSYQLSYGGSTNFIKIFEYLYSDSTVFLYRKVNKFIDCIENVLAPLYGNIQE